MKASETATALIKINAMTIHAPLESRIWEASDIACSDPDCRSIPQPGAFRRRFGGVGKMPNDRAYGTAPTVGQTNVHHPSSGAWYVEPVAGRGCQTERPGSRWLSHLGKPMAKLRGAAAEGRL